LLRRRLRRSGELPCRIEDAGFRRLYWVRYADDLLIGVAGPRSEVVTLREELGSHLQSLGLRLSPAKTLITRATAGPARFLGHTIRVPRLDRVPVGRKVLGGGRTVPVRLSPRPSIYGDLPELVRRLEQRGFCRRGRQGVPTRVGRLVHLTPAMVV